MTSTSKKSPTQYTTQTPGEYYHLKDKIFRQAALHLNVIAKLNHNKQTIHKKSCYLCKTISLSPKILKKFDTVTQDQLSDLNTKEDIAIQKDTLKDLFSTISILIQSLKSNTSKDKLLDNLITKDMNKLLDVFNNLYDQQLEIRKKSAPDPQLKASDFNSIEEYLFYLETQYIKGNPSNPNWFNPMIALENTILSISSTISKLHRQKHHMQPEIFKHTMKLAKKDLEQHLENPSIPVI